MFRIIPWKNQWPRHVAGVPPGRVTYIGFGVNIGSHGERLRIIEGALNRIGALPTTRIVAVSQLYETPPWGFEEQDVFYNGVVAVVTGLSPLALLGALKQIERHLGRRARQRWGPREIDLDILLMGRARVSVPGLRVPHGQLLERAFVLVPLLELNERIRMPDGRRIAAIGRQNRRD